MADMNRGGRYVFGLDIGTRNMVGTVGYKDARDHFIVEAQVALEHKTRAMLDGQIHDIAKVAESIVHIKNELYLLYISILLVRYLIFHKRYLLLHL